MNYYFLGLLFLREVNQLYNNNNQKPNKNRYTKPRMEAFISSEEKNHRQNNGQIKQVFSGHKGTKHKKS